MTGGRLAVEIPRISSWHLLVARDFVPVKHGKLLSTRAPKLGVQPNAMQRFYQRRLAQ
jgi:hypothetical protein